MSEGKVIPFRSASDLRAFILSSDDLPTEELAVPEWGGIKLLMVGLTGEERATLLDSAIDRKSGRTNLKRIYPELVVRCARHPETREPIFEMTDMGMLNKKSGRALERVAQAAVRVCGLSEASLEDAKTDSSATPSDDSTSSLA